MNDIEVQDKIIGCLIDLGAVPSRELFWRGQKRIWLFSFSPKAGVSKRFELRTSNDDFLLDPDQSGSDIPCTFIKRSYTDSEIEDGVLRFLSNY